MRKPTIAALFLLAVMGGTAATASAQGRFMPEGSSGFGFNGGLALGEHATSIGADFGYTDKTSFDVGLGLAYASLDDDVIGPDGSGLSIAPFFSAAAMRPTAESKLGIDLEFSYSFESYNSDQLDQQRVDLTGHTLALGPSFYLKAPTESGTVLYPTIGVHYVKVTATYEDDFGNELDLDNDDIALTFGLGVQFNSRMYLYPAVQTYDGETTLLISLGAVSPRP